MESNDNLELMRIKKEKERAKETEGTPTHEVEKKPPPSKVIEPEIVKTLVPIKVELKEEEKDRPMKVFQNYFKIHISSIFTILIISI